MTEIIRRTPKKKKSIPSTSTISILNQLTLSNNQPDILTSIQVTPKQVEILSLILHHPYITSSKLTKLTKKHRSTIQQYMEKLIAKKLIVRMTAGLHPSPTLD